MENDFRGTLSQLGADLLVWSGQPEWAGPKRSSSGFLHREQNLRIQQVILSPEAAQQLQTIILPPPCLTVGLMFWF